MLAWIKGEPLPGELVNDILKALKLERETVEDRLGRSRAISSMKTAGLVVLARTCSKHKHSKEEQGGDIDADEFESDDEGGDSKPTSRPQSC